jgi:hypothetical protein
MWCIDSFWWRHCNFHRSRAARCEDMGPLTLIYVWEVSEIGLESFNDLWWQRKLSERDKTIDWNIRLHYPFSNWFSILFRLKRLKHPAELLLFLTFYICCMFLIALIYLLDWRIWERRMICFPCQLCISSTQVQRVYSTYWIENIDTGTSIPSSFFLVLYQLHITNGCIIFWLTKLRQLDPFRLFLTFYMMHTMSIFLVHLSSFWSKTFRESAILSLSGLLYGFHICTFIIRLFDFVDRSIWD